MALNASNTGKATECLQALSSFKEGFKRVNEIDLLYGALKLLTFPEAKAFSSTIPTPLCRSKNPWKSASLMQPSMSVLKNDFTVDSNAADPLNQSLPGLILGFNL